MMIDTQNRLESDSELDVTKQVQADEGLLAARAAQRGEDDNRRRDVQTHERGLDAVEKDGDAGREGAGDEHGQLDGLLPHHTELLRNSGISDAVQRARAYKSAKSATEMEELGFDRQQQQVPALLIPVYDLDGQVVFSQARPDQPRTTKGKTAKYENPKGGHLAVDVPRTTRDAVLDGQKMLFVVVGVRKADALVSRGECAIALLGPTGWKDQDAFWNQIPLENRPVVVVLDSNTTTDKAAITAAKGLDVLLERRKAAVQFIVLPADVAGGKIGVDDYLAAGKTVADLLALPPVDPSALSKKCAGEPTYSLTPDGLYRVFFGEKGEHHQRLTTFPAKIISELIVTDGFDETREFEIEATVGGQTKRITVKAAEFESMNWVVKKLGAHAILSAGYGIRDHVRAAIQQLSPQIAKVMVYTHTGGVFHNGHWVFLHAGGAIGADGEIGLAAEDPAGTAAAAAAAVPRVANHPDVQNLADLDDPHSGRALANQGADGEMEATSGVEASHRVDLRDDRAEEDKNRPIPEALPVKDLRMSGTIGTIKNQQTDSIGIRVRLPSVLQGYRLPPPPTGNTLVKAVRASLDFLQTAPDRLSIPLFAATWRAVLGNVNFSLQLVGPTQFGKTVLAALAQQHFGPGMDAEHLPAAWFSTGNAIIATAFVAKDTLTVVDDFLLAGSRGDADGAHRKAEMVLRSQGNQAGRARCRGDGSLVEGKAPRGLIVSTGEDTPDGPSLNSRGLILPVGPADVNWDWVTICQKHAENGLFAMAMAAFLQWMAKNYDSITDATRQQTQALRQVFLHDSMPSRTAAIAANLLAGLENFMDFAMDCGAIEKAKFDYLWKRAHDALRGAVQSHQNDQDSSDPAQRFRELLAEVFHSGLGHVTNRSGEAPNISPEVWGWERFTVSVARPQDVLYSSPQALQDEQEAKNKKAIEDALGGIDTQDHDEYRRRGQHIGWWGYNDDLYLLPDVTLAVVQRLAQAEGRPLPITSRTLGKLLDAKSKLKSKRKGRCTKQIGVGGQVNVLHIDALWINPLFPDPPSKEEQEEERKKFDGLLEA